MAASEAKLWAALIRQLDEVALLDLAMNIGDPFPWRTFLALLDRCDREELSKEELKAIDRATSHLLDVASSLLVIQGLPMLRPEDVLFTSLGTTQAISTLRTKR